MVLLLAIPGGGVAVLCRYGSFITNQLRCLGASCDWSRERFTLDEGLSGGEDGCRLVVLAEGALVRTDEGVANRVSTCASVSALIHFPFNCAPSNPFTKAVTAV